MKFEKLIEKNVRTATAGIKYGNISKPDLDAGWEDRA
jgi:hypothetical protein